MRRLPELDLLRAVALVAVAVIHAAAWLTPAEAAPSAGALAAVSSLARFCVPAFVFASGFALFHGHRERQVVAGSFLRRRWLRVLVPWA
ncbi:MAG TPA: acyltransferase family protein, partial [Chloroflexota bacterium]